MNFDLILAIVFYILLFLFYLKNKKKFQVQGGIFALYKTKLGLKLMDKLAKKYPRLLNFFGYISVVVGFSGMILIIYTLIQGIYKLIFVPGAQPVVAPVIPGVAIQGLPTLGFWHWIIGIFIVAVVHEFSHGVYARLHNVKVKSSGFAFLGPILAAFVEPDEKQLNKIQTKKQLTILSAGPFVNILLGILVILFFNFIFAPLQSHLLMVDGSNLVQVEKGSPAEISGLYPGLIIQEINNIKITSQSRLVQEIQQSNANDIIKLTTDKGVFYVKPTIVDDKPHLGISVADHVTTISGWPQFLLPAFIWFNLLFFWLWVINIGVGLFNLFPLGPITDGGKMVYSSLFGTMNKKKAFNTFRIITIFCVLLLFVNLLPWLIKLFSWIFGLFS